LLLNTGIKAEYHDHPGHTQILLMSLWINFLNFINIIEASSYNDFKNSELIKNNFIELVKYTRFINFFSILLFAYTFYNIFKVTGKNKITSYLLTLLLITSYSLMVAVSHIRTELLSATFIFLSFLFLMKTLNNRVLKKKNIFYLGLFFTLSVFCKFQSIFVFLFFPLLISVLKKNKISIDINYFENKKIHFFLSIIFILGIFLIWLKYVASINYIFFPIGFFYLYLFINYLNNKYFRSKQFNYIFIFYFLLGIIIGFLLLFVFKPFHTNNINMIVNFLGTSSMMIQNSNPYELSMIEIFKLIELSIFTFGEYLKIIFISNSLNELIIFLLSNLMFLILLKNSDYYKSYLKILISLFGIIFIFSVRPLNNYLIYFIPIIYFYFIFLASKIRNTKIVNVAIILLIFININDAIDIIDNKKFRPDENVKKSNCERSNKPNFYIERMRIEIIQKICKK
tara:strand:- start:2826 stop:4190 length:1365 start_codon:yes stop_codon:yes gene_type:complete